MSAGRYLSFNEDDNELLESLTKATGYTATNLLRRMMLLYAGGTPVPGLPKIEPIKAAVKRLKEKT